MSKFQQITLGVTGITALAIGSLLLVLPHAFYGSSGIPLPADPSLASEIRAPGANLAALGGIILAGLLRPDIARISGMIATTVFLAFPLGRLVSILADGTPSESVLGALAIEGVLGALCVVAFWGSPRRSGAVGSSHDLPGSMP